jgi:hypothetical protein
MSEKITIEANFFLSSDTYEFDENLVETDFEDVLLYKDYGNLSDEFEDLTIATGQYDKLLELVKNSGVFEEWRDLLEGADWEDREELMSGFFEESYLPNKFYDSEVIEKIDFLKGNDIESSWSKYDYVTTSGYSQGDERITLINTKEAEEVWGVKPNLEELEKEISHFIYDSPMNLRMIVNDEEYISEKDALYDAYKNYSSIEIQKEFFTMIKKDFPQIEDDILNEALNDVIPSELRQDSDVGRYKTSIYIQNEEDMKEVFKEHPSDVIDGVMGEIEKSDKKVEQKLNS